MGMMKSKKGQYIFFGIMTFIMVWLVLVGVINLLKESITTSLTAMGCDDDWGSLSFGTQATCLTMDFFLPYFFATGLSVGAAYLVGNKLSNV